MVEHDTCYACRSLAIVSRDEARKHKDDPEPSTGKPAAFDGVLSWARPASKADLVGKIRPE